MNREGDSKQEVIFKINKMEIGFDIGYILGSTQDVDFEQALGYDSNEKSSVGIGIAEDKFYLFGQEHFNERLECEAEDGPSSFPEQGQIWRVIWILDLNKMEIAAMNGQGAWTQMIHIAIKEEHREIVPAL